MKEKYLILQIFAEMNTNTTDAMSPEMRTYYDMDLLNEAEPNLVYRQFGQKRPIPANNSKTINFRKFTPLDPATTPLTEGVTPDGETAEVTEVEATVKQYGSYLAVSDILQMTAVDPVIVEFTRMEASQAGRTLDTLCRNEVMTGTNVMYAPTAEGTAVDSRTNLTAECLLTPDVVYTAAARLRAVDAPTINGDYVCILHPYVASDLMKDPNWIDVHKYANPENIYNGEIGKLGGVRFVQTSNAPIVSSSINVFLSLFIGQNAYGVTDLANGGLRTIIKQLGSAGTADPLDQRATIGWKAVTTTKILMEKYILRVESGSSYSTIAKPNYTA